MSSDSRLARLKRHITFFGDCMILIIPVGLLIATSTMNLLSGLRASDTGFVLGVIFAPAAAMSVVWLLRGRTLDRDMGIDVGLATLVVVTLAAGGYGFVVSLGLNQTSGFGTLAVVALGIEGLAAAFLFFDAASDLAGRRRSVALDLIRLAGVALITTTLVLFWTNPDAGELLVTVASLGVVGGVAGLVGDSISALRHRTSGHVARGRPTLSA